VTRRGAGRGARGAGRGAFALAAPPHFAPNYTASAIPVHHSPRPEPRAPRPSPMPNPLRIAVLAGEFDWGGERYLKTGETLPAGGVDELRKFDAIYLGAVGHPDVKPGILEKGLLLELRFQLDQYINLRPVKLFPGVETRSSARGRRTSTSSSSARTPRTCMPASAAF
jgi:hypothetical protein